MTEDQILSELRTIRTLLAFDKQEELQMLIDELDKKDERILEELDFQEWT